MKRKSFWIALAVAVIFLSYFLVRDDSARGIIKNNLDNGQQSISAEIDSPVKSDSKDLNSDAPLYLQIRQCRGDSKDYQIAEEKWLKQLSSFLQELAQSYDLESTVKALAGIIGKYQASSQYDKINREKRRSSYNLVDHSSLERELIDKLGDKALVQHRINWSVIPNEILIGIQQFRPEDINSLLSSGRYDAPYEVIFERVVDLSRNFIGMQNSQYAANNLFEKLALDNQPELLKLYFKNGGLSRNITAGSNALEKLIAKVKKENLTAFTQVIAILNKSGLTVRYRLTENKTLMLGQFLEIFTNFTQDDIQAFESFGFSFTPSETEETVRENPKYFDIANAITENREQYLREQLGVDSLQKYTECGVILETATKSLASQLKIDKANALFKKYSNDLDTLNSKLHKLEPGLTDCAVKRKPFKANSEINEPRYDDINRIAKTNREQGIHQAIAEALKLDLSNQEKSFLFWRLAEIDARNIPFISDYGLMPESFSTTELIRSTPSIIEALTDLGYDFDTPSDTGRNLVESAVTACNSHLINWMAEHNYTYQYSDIRSDALALSLREPCFNNIQKQVDLVSAVMQFNPPIKSYHHQRMAELRLRNYDVFTKLVSRYPQLNINDDVKPSGYICNIVSHSTEHFSIYR